MGPPDLPRLLKTAERFGRYELYAELATGGMGTIYLARARGPGGYEKTVALKRIHDHLAKQDRFVDMFMDEARLAARIHHPNVCGVIDFGEHEGQYYLAMPFVVGASLSQLQRAVVQSDGTSWENDYPYVAARLIADACEGLHAAHELRGEDGELLDVIHRDVSPSNIIVGYDGVARVIDFGVATARQRLHQTMTGEIKGKLGYGAPEQLKAETVDRRADVWSLGVVLWECFCRRRLFAHEGLSKTVMAVSTAPIEPIRDHWPDAPLEFEEIVFTALNRDPERRYPNAREMGRALDSALRDVERPVASADIAEWLSDALPERQRIQMNVLQQGRALVGAKTRRSKPTGSTWIIGFAGLALVGISVIGTLLAVRGEESQPLPVSARRVSEPIDRHENTPPTPGNDAESPPVPPPAPPRDPNDSPANPPVTARTNSVRDTPGARRRGTVRVTTAAGWAYVYAGGRRLEGEAPGDFRLPVGRHVLRIQPLGHGSGSRHQVRVRPGEIHRLHID